MLFVYLMHCILSPYRMQPAPTHSLPSLQVRDTVACFLNETNAFMAETTALLLSVNVCRTQSTVCCSNQDIIGSELDL